VAGDGRTGVSGTVTAQLPQALYRVVLESGHEVVAHLTGDARRNFVRVLVGDRVVVVVSPYDVTRGRIVSKGAGGDDRRSGSES
jgi:translation initiation factor IF-1